jgi:hypothetical protein
MSVASRPSSALGKPNPNRSLTGSNPPEPSRPNPRAVTKIVTSIVTVKGQRSRGTLGYLFLTNLPLCQLSTRPGPYARWQPSYRSHFRQERDPQWKNSSLMAKRILPNADQVSTTEVSADKIEILGSLTLFPLSTYNGPVRVFIKETFWEAFFWKFCYLNSQSGDNKERK